MASTKGNHSTQQSMLIIFSLLLITTTFSTIPCLCSAARTRMLFLVQPDPVILKYHNGPLLKGKVTVNVLWYGKFTPKQRSVITDFLESLSSHQLGQKTPTVASWWLTTSYYKGGPSYISIGEQAYDNYSLGRFLSSQQVKGLALKLQGVSKTTKKHYSDKNTVNLVLTGADVAVEDFCMSTCGSHDYHRNLKKKNGTDGDLVYAWVGNPGTQCPGECAWPFHKPVVGPQTPPLVAPNGDVGVDGMLITLATVLAGTVTNPYDSGYFQGPATAALEAVTACTGMFGSGSFPGYPGKVLVDKRTKASYNAVGQHGREYLLPAMWDPKTRTCKTLV